MTSHFLYGCPWADGEKYLSDTDQRYSWTEVTCKHCLKLRKYGYGRKRRAKRYDWNAKADQPKKN